VQGIGTKLVISAERQLTRRLCEDQTMNDWLHNLPILWMALVIFGFTFLVAAAIYLIVMLLAAGERGRSFKAVSPGMLSPLGILFGLFVAFTAAQVWNDTERADAAVSREASALRSVIVLASSFPGEPEARMRALVRSYIEQATTQEWPMMAQRTATLRFTPRPLVEVLKLDLSLVPVSPGQQLAQHEIAAAVENALDARRQRIIVSMSGVSSVKWACLFVQAVCALFAIALVHSGDRLAAAITMGMFALGVAVCVLLIMAYDRPFTGHISVAASPLLQVMPEGAATGPSG
jgi:hypothetical protein